MAQISVLIVVDALAALASNNLQQNVYLVDTNKFFGSGAEGQAELVTGCKDGDVISWSVAPVDPNSNVSINSFTGQMVSQKICQPTSSTLGSWMGRVETQQAPAQRYQYSAVIAIDGTLLAFDPFLNVTA